MELFWRKGYSGASLSDLTAAMGINAPSLYAAFGSKEALLNVAFAGSPPWSLLCPYDTEALPPDVIDEARRTHPVVVEDGTRRESASYHGLEAVAAATFDGPLPEPPLGDWEDMVFGEASLFAQVGEPGAPYGIAATSDGRVYVATDNAAGRGHDGPSVVFAYDRDGHDRPAAMVTSTSRWLVRPEVG
jgi:hypothetical protein